MAMLSKLLGIHTVGCVGHKLLWLGYRVHVLGPLPYQADFFSRVQVGFHCVKLLLPLMSSPIQAL